MISVEIGIRSSRIEHSDFILNSEHLKANLDLLEEAREEAANHMAHRAQQVGRYYNRQVNDHQF